MINDGLEPEERAKIIRLIKAIVPDAEIYLYGSRARGTFRHGSDVDIALKGEGLNRHKACEAKDVLEASRLPYAFDVVALIPETKELYDVIKNEMVLWMK